MPYQFNSFLQSAEWEEIQKLQGRNTRRIQNVLIIRHDLPLGFNYFYAPRPRFDNPDLLNFFEAAKKVGHESNAIFFKIDPDLVSPNLSGVSFHKTPSLQPQKTIVLDLTNSEEDLWASFHPKTRYNIGLAERKGVEIEHYSLTAFSQARTFYELLTRTAQRNQFHLHNRHYYEKLLQISSDQFSNELFFATRQGIFLAGALVNFYQPSSSATYLHGGSLYLHRAVMSPHLLQWHIIKEAKKRNMKFYDLWGVDEKRWPGVTRFKMGFGGKVHEYPDSIEIVYSPVWYKLYQLQKKLH